jgi:PAS domain S-box-containing protein
VHELFFAQSPFCFENHLQLISHFSKKIQLMSKKVLTNEAILGSTFETVQDGVCILDIEFNVLRVNSFMQRLFPDSQLVGKKCYEAFLHRATPCEVCSTRETIETEKIAYTRQHIKINDKVYWLDIYSFPLIDPITKKMTGILEFIRDISEQRETEEALRASEAKYRTLVEKIPAVIYMAPPHDFRKTLFISPQIETLLGIPKTDFEADPDLWPKLIHPEDRKRVLAEIDRCQRREEPIALEYRLRSKDGLVLWVHDAAWMVRDGKGQPLFLQGIVQDITDRKQAETAFFHEHEKYQVLAASAPLGIAIIGENGKYQYLNPKFVDMFGYSLEDIPSGREWFATAFPDPVQRRQVITDWKIYLQESQFGETKPRTFTVTCKDGSTKVINFRAVPLGGGDQFVLYEDITERVKAVEALKENEERFRLVLDCSADAIFVHDKGKIIEVNQKACDSLGYSREELLTRSIMDIEVAISPESLAQFYQENIDQPLSLLGVHKRQDGSTFPVEVSVNAFDYKGKKLRIAQARDITARLEAEEALKQSELKYRTLVEQIPAITYTTAMDEQSITTYVSPQIETLLGIAPADYEADPNAWVNQLHPDDRGRVLAELEQCLSTGEPFATEYRMMAKDGRIVWVRDEARLVRNDSSRQLFLQGVMVDITERKELERALQESEELYRTLFETSPEAITLSGADLKIIMANQEAAALYGVERPEEILGRSTLEFVAPESLPLAQTLEAMDHGGLIEAEFVLLKKDGSSFIAETRTSILRNPDGSPKAFLSVTKDVTGRKEAEEKLLAAKREWERTFDTIPDLIMILDKQHRIVRANQAMARKLGVSPAEAVGMTCYGEVHGSETPPHFCPHSLMLASGQTQQVEIYEERLNGHFLVSVVPLKDSTGQLAGSVHVAKDITERKRSEQALKDSEEKYRLLVQQVPALVFKGYNDWSIDCFDNKIEELTGYSAEDFNSRRLKWRNLIPEEDLASVKQTFQEALEGDHSYIHEHRIRKKNGDYAWVQCRGQIFLNEKEKVESVSAVTFDITERKRVEEALRKSEERYRLIAENVSDVIWTTDMDLRITYISPSVQQTLGFTPEEIIGKAIGEIFLPASLGQALEIFHEELVKEMIEPVDRNRSRIFELDEVHKNGAIIRSEVKASFIRDANNQPIGILGVTRDITKRQVVQEALRRREAVLEAVSFAAEKFLRDTDWENHIRDILGHLGQAIAACRVNIFENHRNPEGDLLTSQRYEWEGRGTPAHMPDPQLQGMSLKKMGLGHWEDMLPQGQVIWHEVENFSSVEQEFLRIQKIKSILVLPIFVGQEWWGFVTFDDCRRKRSWSSPEVDALLTAADILGTAILHGQSEKALRESEEKLRSLSNQLLSAQEDERKQLSTELHNVLGHDLLLLKLKLESLHDSLPAEQTTQQEEVQKIINALQDSVSNVRRLYKYLTPGDIEDLGLTTALRVLVENFAVAKKLTWLIEMDDIDRNFMISVQTAIYRMVKEALTNIGKHANAGNLAFRAKRTGTEVSFYIEDDGDGFNVAEALAAKRTLGLLAMEEQVKILGGSFAIVSQQNQGTKISFTIPTS